MLVHIFLIYLCICQHVVHIHGEGDHGKLDLIETQVGRKYIAKMPTDVEHSSGKGTELNKVDQPGVVLQSENTTPSHTIPPCVITFRNGHA